MTRKSDMHSGRIRRSGAIAGRMACSLAAALLVCASSAQGQVIGEEGFPVKGEALSSEPFSLSCPPRLVARAGESVPFSCAAAGVPEEGVRYSWESLPEGGLDLLNATDEASPLFTAPVSGEIAEYAYRLTAAGPGVYATASVTVTVEGVSVEGVSVQGVTVQGVGAPAGSPAMQEDCDPFMLPEGFSGGCPEDNGPVPFGLGPEEEFPFPDGLGPPSPPRPPGPPGSPSGPVREEEPDSRTPPRLECPAAVFLEELETGEIACHAWDIAGGEYLDFAWEPVGGATRDYLDNPRLFPENSLTPSVIAPETPARETLASFRSEEATFRYRYRLTATSRATGLSSFSEVEVFVSNSRPGVYCPLEVEVEEGETVSLDCEGSDPLSARMDYDEEAASVLWEWEGLWGTDTAPLEATHLSSPLFTAPAGSAGREYHYIVSMTSLASGAPRAARRKVTVRVTGPEEKKQAASGRNASAALEVTCDGRGLRGDFYVISELDGDLNIKCEVTGGSEGTTYTYVWTGVGTPATENPLIPNDSLEPVFMTPNVTDQDDVSYKFRIL